MRADSRIISAGLAVLVSVTLAGCATPSEPPSPGPEPTETSEPSPTTEPTRSAEPTPLDDLEIRLERIATGLDNPLFVTHAGDGSGRLFVVEQGGRVRVVRDSTVAQRPFLDVSDRISAGGERGLLGLAFAPDYEESGRFYVNYTDLSGDTVVARFIAENPSSDAPRLSGPQVVLTVDQPYANHNGGCIVFGPDRRLYVGMGDGGAAGDPQGRAQNPAERLGKLLALDVEPSEGRPRPDVVARGLRNPWRFSFDRETDDAWIADVGQNAWEEVNLVSFDELDGRNFGWDVWEGSRPYERGSGSRRGFTFPVIEYGHDEGISVTGGYVYRGSDYPQLAGTYFYGDFGMGFLAGARVGADGRVRDRVLIRETGQLISSFGEDEQGELYVCDHNGSVSRIEPK